MAENTGTLRCQLGCWSTGALAGLLTAVIMIVVGDVSATGSIFVGLVMFVVLSLLLGYLLCRPLPTLSEVQARGPASAGTGRSGGSKPSASKASASKASDTAPAGVPPIGAAAAADERGAHRSASTDGPAPIGAAAAADSRSNATSSSGDSDEEEGTKPPTLDAPRDGKADDLKEIKGVGPKLEEMLHGMGIYHFDQIANWGRPELAWVDANLEGFKGRASRDDWVAQAKVLAGGGETEFSKRVEDGDVY